MYQMLIVSLHVPNVDSEPTCTTGHNLTGIASQFAMHLGFTCDVISVTHRSD